MWPGSSGGKSCKGPTPPADIKSFLPVVCMRVLENLPVAHKNGAGLAVVRPQRDCKKNSSMAQKKLKIKKMIQYKIFPSCMST